MEKFLFKKIEFWIVLIMIIAFWFIGAMAVNSSKDNFYGSFGKASQQVLNLPNVVIELVLEIFPSNTHSAVPTNIKNALIATKKSNASKSKNKSPVVIVPKDMENSLQVVNKTLFSPSFKIPIHQIKDDKTVLSIINPRTGESIDWQVPGRVANYSKFDNTLIVKMDNGKEDSTKGLKKVDQTGKILWEVDIHAHHAVYVSDNGYIYTPTKNTNYEGPPKKILDGFSKYRDDGYAIISPAGKIVKTGSITQILLDNGLGHFIYGVGALERDAIHLNAVKSAPTTQKNYDKGDLLFSIRHQSMIFMYKPETNKVIWFQVGPWTNQHDPDFLPDGRISVFGNDVASYHKNRTLENAKLINGQNDIYILDPEDHTITKPYTEFMKSVNLTTITGGAHRIYSDGSLAVHFSNRGIMAYFHPENKSIMYYYKQDNNEIDRASGLATLLH